MTEDSKTSGTETATLQAFFTALILVRIMLCKRRLIVMSGLPGLGKSTLAEQLAAALSRPVLSIDPIEAAMWRGGLAKETTGVAAYEVARALADQQLELGLSVIIDAANLIELAREMRRTLAAEHGLEAVMIECVCKDVTLEQKKRVFLNALYFLKYRVMRYSSSSCTKVRLAAEKATVIGVSTTKRRKKGEAFRPLDLLI